MTLTVNNEWPSTVPLPAVEFQGAPKIPSAASPESSFYISRRKRFENTYHPLSVNWTLDPTQLEEFESFFLDDLGNGTSQFKIELKYPKTTELKFWIVRFIGGYRKTCLDRMWRIEAVLEIVSPYEI